MWRGLFGGRGLVGMLSLLLLPVTVTPRRQRCRQHPSTGVKVEASQSYKSQPFLMLAAEGASLRAEHDSDDKGTPLQVIKGPRSALHINALIHPLKELIIVTRDTLRCELPCLMDDRLETWY